MRRMLVWRPGQGREERLVWIGAVADVDYWHDRWSRQRLETSVRDARGHPVLRDLFLCYSPEGGRVLEGGCGLGQWVAVLRGAGRVAVGLDYDTATLRVTRGDALGCDLPLLGGDVCHLPFNDGAFDTYISLGVAEHFPSSPRPLLDEARRVLRPGGVLLISVPYFNPLRRLRARLGGYAAIAAVQAMPRDFYQYAFRQEEFAILLGGAGFVVEAVAPFAAATGLREDFPWLARARSVGEGAAAREGGATARRDAPRRAVLRRIAHARPVRRCAGHMILFAARRADGRGEGATWRMV